MPENQNPKVPRLLAWQSDGAGSVRIPFGGEHSGSPLGETLETPVTKRILRLVDEWTQGQGPRLVVLVGGPGNGKSQIVEFLVEHLDTALDAEGKLVEHFRHAYVEGNSPRAVSATAEDIPALAKTDARLFRVVQDASQADSTRQGDAEAELCRDIESALADDQARQVVCVNRGMLARGIQAAQGHVGRDARDCMAVIALATAAVSEPKDCWPLAEFPHVAAWPMDVESLLDSDELSSAAHILMEASDEKRWEHSGCSDCDSRAVCPLLLNAQALRSSETREGMLTWLRDAEHATGQYWTFRDLFTWAAELTVGARSDYGQKHPCTWVHFRRRRVEADEPSPEKVRAVLDLHKRLQTQAVFPRGPRLPSRRELGRFKGKAPLYHALGNWLKAQPKRASTHFRARLDTDRLAASDPAQSSPRNGVLRDVEDWFNHGVAFAREQSLLADQLNPLEQELLGVMQAIEDDLAQQQGNEATAAAIARVVVRRLAVAAAKRRISITSGEHPSRAVVDRFRKERFSRYELRWIIRQMLGNPGAPINASLATAFRPELSENEKLVRIRAPGSLASIQEGERGSAQRPQKGARILIGETPVHLTFELYQALTQLARGCYKTSIATPVQSLLTRLQDTHVGRAAHDRQGALDGHVQIWVGPEQEDKETEITLQAAEARPWTSKD